MESSLTPEQLIHQEHHARLKQFDFLLAWRLGQLLYEQATALAAPVSLEVYAFGQELFVAALPGSCAENLEWMRRKRNTVLRCAHSSLYVGMINASRGEPMATQSYIDPCQYTDHGGAFPLMNLAGGLIGAVSVSGLPSEEDHALALGAIQQLQLSIE